MKYRHTLRLLLSLTANLAALGSGLGCLPSATVNIAGVDFAPAFTLDRQPVPVDTAGQSIEDPGQGPYTRAPGQVASLLYPDVQGIDHLLQADCFWAGRDGAGGDRIRLNWEVFLWVASEYDGKYLPAGDEDVSACRLNDPLTRQPKHFSSPTAPQFPSMIVALPGDPVALNLSFEGNELEALGYDFSFDNGHEWYGVELEAVPPVPVAPDDRSCDFGPFGGSPMAVGPGVWSYDAGGDTAGRVAFCSGQGRTVVPLADARFRATLREGDMVARQWFDTVMVAEAGERLVRPAAVQGNDVAWSVPTFAGRWHENFSPSLRVEEIRLLRRDPSGDEAYLEPGDLDVDTLCVAASSGSTTCLYDLPRQTDADGYAVWRPLAPPPGGTVHNLTPGYDANALANLTEGQVVGEPLEWRAIPIDPVNLHLEFRLGVVLAPMAVDMDSMALFGQVPPGETRYRRLTLTNVGGRSVSIDAVGIVPINADPGEFTSLVLGDPKPVPVGIELIREEGLEIKIAEDYEEFPVYRADEYEDATLLYGDDLDGQTFERNGYELKFDGPTALHADPAADFQPQYAPGQTRPYHLISHLPLPLPRSLAPGENLRIQVRFEASQPGERTADLQVDLHDPVDGTPGVVLSSLVAEALHGPIPAVYPEVVLLSDSGPGQNVRNLLLTNNGDQDLMVNDHAITGPDANRINVTSGPSAAFQLPPAQMEVFTFEYTDACAPPGQFIDHEAELWLDTDAGELTVPIRMRSQNC